MVKFIPWNAMLSSLVADQRLLPLLSEVLQAILEAGSARWSDIARKMRGSEAAAYKRIQRLVARFDPWSVVIRLCPEQAPFVIADITDIERPHAYRTAYVGFLPPEEKPGPDQRQASKARGGTAKHKGAQKARRKPRRGFWLLVLGVPFRGRVLPCAWRTFSSRTLEGQVTSQNTEVEQALDALQDLLQGRALVFDRGFQNRRFFAWLQRLAIPFVARVRMKPHPLVLTTEDGERLQPVLLRGETRVWHSISHHELQGLTLIGHWPEEMPEPLWLLTTWPDAQQALAWYLRRMKIEETFRDWKTLLGVEANMNRRWLWMDRTMGLVVLAYAIALLAGELLRDALWGSGLPDDWSTWHRPQAPKRAWYQFSGLFVLLRKKVSLPASLRRRWRRLLVRFPLFLLHAPVQTFV